MAVEGEHAIVIGAGVIGAGVALELARSGFQVTVLDRGASAGTGSTSASSAIVRYHYRHRDEAVVAWESGRRWRQWKKYLGVSDPTGMATFVESGLLVLPGQELDMTQAREHLRALGIVVEGMTADEARERFPGLEPTSMGPPSLPSDDRFWVEGGEQQNVFWMPECGFIDDPQLAAHNLAHAAEYRGATFRFRTEVTEIVQDQGRVAGVLLATGELVAAPVVVNVAGPWSGAVNQLAGVLDDFATSTRPLEQEVIALPAPADFTLGLGFCVTDADLGTYFRPHHGDSLLVGGMEAACDPLVWLQRPEDAHPSVTADNWHTQSLRVARRLPSVRVPGRPAGIVGVYDVTADWIPIYDRTSLDGYYVAIGTSGHGFKQAPFVGELMANLVRACEAGHPHDSDPLQVSASWTGNTVDLGHFSRLRTVDAQAAMG